MALLAVPMAASAFSGPSVGQPSRSALRMQLVPVESTEKVKMNDFGIMQRYLGNTDLLVSECCLGGMTWGDQNTEADAETQLNFAFDNGVNFLDTAEGYPVPMAPGTQGATDRAIGKWLKSCFWTREQVVISTKVCGYNERYTWFRESGEGTRLTKAQIIESVDASLKRLGTDYIDVLQLHWPDRYVALTGSGRVEPRQRLGARSLGVVGFDEQVEGLKELVDAGKIRHWGLSNENTHGINEFRAAADAVGLEPPCIVQNAYSLLQRIDETSDVMGACLGDGAATPPMSYVAYSPLSAGVLTGKYAAMPARPGGSGPPKRSRLKMFKGYGKEFAKTEGPAAVAAYMAVAKKHRITPAQLAIAHCNSRGFVTSTIIGSTTMNQLTENLSSFLLEWTQELEDDVRSVYAAYPDPWRVQVIGGG
jgi:aryl-alcohol dehydrogenase-like predicted oxidoreductase